MDEHQRPEGRLIEDALDRLHLSARKAAEGTGVSDTRLRHIARGYQPVGRGQVVEVVAPADTLARIAARLDITADQLRDAGREDAADALAAQVARSHGVGVVLDVHRYERALESMGRWWAAEGDPERPIHPPADALWLWTPGQLSSALGEQTSALERAFSEGLRAYTQGVMRARRTNAREGSEDRGGDSAATTQAGGSPVEQALATQLAEVIAAHERALGRIRRAPRLSPEDRRERERALEAEFVTIVTALSQGRHAGDRSDSSAIAQ